MINYKIKVSNDLKIFLIKIIFLFGYKSLLCLFIHKWLLLGNYYFLSPEYDLKKFAIGFIFFLLTIFFLKNNFINKLFLILILFIVYPSIALFEMTNFSIYTLVVTFISLLLIYIFSNFFIFNYNIFSKFKILSLKKSYYFCCMLIFAYILFIFSQVDFGNKFITDLRKFSDLRYILDFKNEVYYFNSIITVSILPYVLILSLYKKRFIFFAIFIILYFFLAFVFMSKILLFIPLISVFMYLFYNKKYFFILTLTAPIVLLIISFIEIEILVKYNGIIDYFGSGIFGNFLIRRIILIPSIVNFSYLEFFALNDFLYWGESKISLGLLNELQFLPSSSKIIGNYFYLDTYSVNSGLIGSGYANLGIWGVIIYSILVGLLFSLLNSVSQHIKSNLVFSIFFANIYYIFLVSDLLTVINSYGLAFLILLIILTDFKEYKSPN